LDLNSTELSSFIDYQVGVLPNYYYLTGDSDMKAVLLFLITLIPCAVFAQDYIEASGQTVAFELKAGSTAAWNSGGSSVLYSQPVKSNQSILVRMQADRKTISVTNVASSQSHPVFELFSVNGCRLARASLSSGSQSLSLKTSLTPGYYLARVKQNGTTIHTTTFFVAR
jgi:hypothetical protein